MSESSEKPVTVTKKKRATTRAGRARKPGQTKGRKPRDQEATPPDRGAYLAIVDFFDGNCVRASQATGIPVSTLHYWRNGGGEVVEAVRSEIRTSLIDDIHRYLRALMVIGLIKAADPRTTYRDIYYGMGIMSDKIENMTKLHLMTTFDQDKALGRDALPASAQPVMSQLPNSVEAESQRLRWEETLSTVMEQAELAGEKVTRDQAIESIVRLHPEAAPYLPLEAESEVIQGVTEVGSDQSN